MFHLPALLLAALSCTLPLVLAINQHAQHAAQNGPDHRSPIRRELADDDGGAFKGDVYADGHVRVMQTNADVDLHKTGVLSEVSRQHSSPFCRSLCRRTDIASKSLKQCKSLSEGDCRSSKFYATMRTGEKRLCIWQTSWHCTEDFTTMCADEKVACDAEDAEPHLDFCASLCYKTDVKSTDMTCSTLQVDECSSGQFYESDETGRRRLCIPQESLTCAADPSQTCEATELTCPPAVSSFADGRGEQSQDVCNSLCYTTNLGMAGIACKDLDQAQCSSEQYYGTDSKGERRRCELSSAGTCDFSSIHFCQASSPICAGLSAPRSDAESTAGATPSSGAKSTANATSATADELKAESVQGSPFNPVGDGDENIQPPVADMTTTDDFSIQSYPPYPAAAAPVTVPAETTTTTAPVTTTKATTTAPVTTTKATTTTTAPVTTTIRTTATTASATGPTSTPSTAIVSPGGFSVPAFCLTLCHKTITWSMNRSCAELSPAQCNSGRFYSTDRKGDRRMCAAQAMGNCDVDWNGPKCEAWWPICEVPGAAGALDGDGSPRSGASGSAGGRSRHVEVEEGCLVYCHRTNVRSNNRSCLDLSKLECASDHFYETDRAGGRMMCMPLKSGDCRPDVTTLCEHWKPICQGAAPHLPLVGSTGGASSTGDGGSKSATGPPLAASVGESDSERGGSSRNLARPLCALMFVLLYSLM